MRIGSQPRSRRGTIGHPYTALNLRLVLASSGLVILAVLAAALLSRGHLALGIAAAVLAAVTVVDLVVIQLRRRQRRRTDPRQHSLFE
ncbi:MAG: hypothetical protein IRZ05_08420 [Micromonosporaceae bacterium]|jgi:hypothetical protein|nr:hypothetical protein [Micromonosporaceae bacterium]